MFLDSIILDFNIAVQSRPDVTELAGIAEDILHQITLIEACDHLLFHR